MLILTRRKSEMLVINDDITITVLGIKGKQVSLGINAPKDVQIFREELYQKIQLEKADSTGSSSKQEVKE